MNAALDFIERHRRLLDKKDDHAFTRAHETFLQELACLADGFLDAIPPAERPARSSSFIDCQLRWLGLQERSKNFHSFDPVVLALEMFGPGVHHRMAPLEAAASRGFRQLVMVGCGPLPLTVLWMANRFPEMKTIALDTDADSLVHAREFSTRSGLPPIHFLLMNGRD